MIYELHRASEDVCIYIIYMYVIYNTYEYIYNICVCDMCVNKMRA